DVPEELVDHRIHPLQLGDAVPDAHRLRLRPEVAILPARDLVEIHLRRGRAKVRLERRVDATHRLPVFGVPARRLQVQPRRARLPRARPPPGVHGLGWGAAPPPAPRAVPKIPPPASAANSSDAICPPAVSWVWKWIGMPTASFSAFTSARAAYGRHS